MVYTEPFTIRIGEAEFQQLANVVSFCAADTIFPRKIYFSAKGRCCSKRYLRRKIDIRMLYFCPNSLLSFYRINVIESKTTNSYLSPSWHALCVIASNLRSPEFGCITYAEGALVLGGRASLGNTETYTNSIIVDAVILSLFMSDTGNMRHPSRLIAPG